MNRPTPEEHRAAKWLPLEERFFITRSLIRSETCVGITSSRKRDIFTKQTNNNEPRQLQSLEACAARCTGHVRKP